MVKVKAELDANRAETAMHSSRHPTEKNLYDVYCDMCGEVFFVDELTFEKVSAALREGFDNPFICDDCRDELGEEPYL
jgi:hypothetical protein